MAPLDERDAAPERQREIYLDGAAGLRPKVPVHPGRLEEAAAEAMSEEAYAYVAGGAGLEQTMAANRAAFGRWRIVPRMLRDVSSRDLTVDLFGRRQPPLYVCPIGVLSLAHRRADVAVARAAARCGVPMVFSNQASASMEECARAMDEVAPGATRWFQLYWSRSDDLVASFASRAEACGCSAIVITLDTTMLGWRTRDLDLAWLPFLRGMGLAQYLTDPVFQRLVEEAADEPPRRVNLASIALLLELTRRHPGAFLENLRSKRPLRAVRQFISLYSRSSLRWEDLAFLRERTRLPILLKGILSPEDAALAVEHGLDGIIVSNHGGRQVDGAVAALDALPGVVDRVAGRVPVLFDSGVRTGADALKALALGAAAVGVGRPYVYGLALAGEEGVAEVLRNMGADLELTMGLAGCRSLSDVGRDMLVRE